MSLLATDFEDTYLTTEMGSICPEVQFHWISHTIERCPLEFHNAMCNDIIQAFFKSPVDLFVDFFGPAVARIIYEKGHMLSFIKPKCFIERSTIEFRKELPFDRNQYKCALHISLGGEEIARMLLIEDVLTDWPTNGEYVIKNPYYVDSE